MDFRSLQFLVLINDLILTLLEVKMIFKIVSMSREVYQLKSEMYVQSFKLFFLSF